jgi:AraC family transcriptional regulator
MVAIAHPRVLMLEQSHGPTRHARSRLLMSSEGRGWRGVAAELRYYPAGMLPPCTFTVTEVAVCMRSQSAVTRQAGDTVESFVGSPGTIGLSPTGVHEEYAELASDLGEMLHIYLPANPFTALAKHTSRNFDASVVDYRAGFKDPGIGNIANQIAGELRFETSCGDLLVEILADELAVRLLSHHSNMAFSLTARPIHSRTLDADRLKRVMNYINAHLRDQITVEELASVASFSRFHFSRKFKATVGQSPSSFVGRLRLELAKLLLSQGASIADTAFDCGFSSESNFVRSFRRAVGVTPGQYRATIGACGRG